MSRQSPPGPDSTGGATIDTVGGHSNSELQERLRAALPGLVDTDSLSAYAEVPGAPFVRGAKEAGRVDPSDIRQGQVGDCGIAATLAALALASPDAVEASIRTCTDGSYEVRLFEQVDHDERGVELPRYELRPVWVKVDARFPMRGALPSYLHSDDPGELWPMLLEKALATMVGSYDSLDHGGTAEAAFQTVGGIWASSIDLSALDRATLLTAVEARLAEGHPMVLSFPQPERLSGAQQRLARRRGVELGHAYTVTGLNRSKGTLILRNPWGSQHLPAMGVEDLRTLGAVLSFEP